MSVLVKVPQTLIDFPFNLASWVSLDSLKRVMLDYRLCLLGILIEIHNHGGIPFISGSDYNIIVLLQSYHCLGFSFADVWGWQLSFTEETSDF